jgi:hypothetical protein
MDLFHTCWGSAAYWENSDETLHQVDESHHTTNDKDKSNCEADAQAPKKIKLGGKFYHILELALIVSAKTERELLVRLEFLRQLYNACLGELLKRLDSMRQSPEYADACTLPKTVNGKPNKKRTDAFAKLRITYGVTEFSISAFATKCKNQANWNTSVEGSSKPKVCVNEIKISLPNNSQITVFDGLKSVDSNLTDILKKTKLVISELEETKKATNQVSEAPISLKKQKKNKKNLSSLKVGAHNLEKLIEILGKIRNYLEKSVEVPSKTVSAISEVIRKSDKVIPGSEQAAVTFEATVCGVKKAVGRLKKVLDDLPKSKRSKSRIGAHEVQNIAQRVFDAVEKYALGIRGKPRFKGKSRPLHSIEGKCPTSGIRWHEGTDSSYLIWNDLHLPAMLASKRDESTPNDCESDPKDHELAPNDCESTQKDRDPWQTQSLRANTKYSRIIWRMINGKLRWFAQLIQEGLSPLKYEIVHGVVGGDLGPSTVAIVSEKAVGLVPLAPEVIQPWEKIFILQRKMERSRRATNPQCYKDDGTYISGSKIEKRSKNYEKLRKEIQEYERVLRETRKHSLGRLTNCIFACGNVVKIEKISIRSWQKNFGRSVKLRAPGLFMEMLRRKAERTGGVLHEVDTWNLKLSQYDHWTDTYKKKPLNQRWHVPGDKTSLVQRDLYSAFLAFCVEKTPDGKDVIHPSYASSSWPAAKSLLDRAGWIRKKPVSVESILKKKLATAPEGPKPQSFGLRTPERSHGKHP